MKELILIKAFGLTGLQAVDPDTDFIIMDNVLSGKPVQITYSDTGEVVKQFHRSFDSQDNPINVPEKHRLFELTRIEPYGE
jgi:hypothetical protein